MENEMSTALKEMVEAFSKLSDEEQVKEIEDKIKVILGIMNGINNGKLTLVSTSDIKDEGTDLTKVFTLLCSLEEEIAKLLLK